VTYVRYLGVSGFKGFRDWNLLDLSPRVSVLVGDNGTGKSSLVEALLWCLGADPGGLRVAHRRELLFQPPSDAYSRIRHDTDQHILYHSADTGRQAPQESREPEAGAEEAVVYLVLGDETEAGGVPQQEEGCGCKPSRETRHDVPPGLVTVTRRLDWQGAESLLLDGEPASEEQVAQALAPHGLGRAQVSVIRQGELERVLVADPVQRAAILAQAADIVPVTSAHGTMAPPPSALRARLVRACLTAWGAGDRIPGGPARLLCALGLPDDVSPAPAVLLAGIAAERRAHEDRHAQDQVARRVSAARFGRELTQANRRVGERFAGFFEQLVPGGWVALDLDLPEDGRPPALDVRVAFPGCEPERIDSLSGGQRTLVAFAFGLALFLEKPTRLIVLDEVEPALDENNLRRFNALLGEVAATRQVLLVSHQRGTRDVGDATFGIDRSGEGASVVHYRYEPSTKGLVVFGHVRGNWLERTEALTGETVR
jgi:hypothetical protein